MVIVDKERDSIMTFKEIEVGEVFRYNNSVYLKIKRSRGNAINAFNLSKPETNIFYEEDLVQAVNATLTIEPW